MYIDCTKLTLLHASTATDAGLRIDDVRHFAIAGNGTNRTGTGTERTTTTLFRIDEVLGQIAALMSRTTFFLHVSHIFIVEIIHGREYRVG